LTGYWTSLEKVWGDGSCGSDEHDERAAHTRVFKRELAAHIFP